MNDIFYWLEGLDDLSYNKVKNYITNLHQENQKYKEVIDKAIEIISKEFLCYDNESDEYIQGIKLLDILKEAK